MKAILTGHTRGLGAAIAEQLLGRGIAVLAVARGRNAGLGARFPGLLQEVEMDLADAPALAAWLAGGEFGRFLAGGEALLVNNAGMLQPMGPAGSLDVAAIARAVALNVTAPMMLADAFIAAGGRRVLHVSSGAARSAYAGWSVYCATKAALDQHARAVALDGVPGLRICSLAPGVIDTDMQAEIRASAPERFPMHERFVSLKQQGQLSSPAEAAARLVDYLLSERFGEEATADIRSL